MQEWLWIYDIYTQSGWQQILPAKFVTYQFFQPCNSTNITELCMWLHVYLCMYIYLISDIDRLMVARSIDPCPGEVLSPHILVSYFRQTTHQSVRPDTCLFNRFVFKLSLDPTAVFCFTSWRALVAILMTQYFCTCGNNLIVTSTCVSVVQPKGPIAEWNGWPT